VSRKTISVVAAAAAALALLLSGCATATSGGTPAASSSADAFPVTIEHAFGETTIDAAPKRVVAIGWGSADAAIALGTIPVAIPFQSYGGNKEGVLPWIADALEKDGAATPTVLPESTDDPPYEDIAKANPDLILAAYSGITKEQYALLSKIAPVVAYPGAAWSTPWRDVISIVGKALGKSTEATALLKNIDGQIADAAAAHPEFKGKTIAETWDTGGKFYVYKKADPRVEFTLGLGFTSAPSVEALATDESPFYYTMSYEKLDQLTSDVLVSFGSTQEESDAFLKAGYAQVMPQVKNGAVASPVGTEFIASVSPPTALSLPWGLDDYVALLSKAAKAADAAK
jgi:iron complex transport system substrate-binding protein